MAEPWEENHWIPGVLSQEQVRCLYKNGYLKGIGSEIDPSAFDLHITDKAYIVNKGTVKPDGRQYTTLLNDRTLFTPFRPDRDSTFELQPKRSYLFVLREALGLPVEAPFCGQATPKSSIGRLDVITRLIVSGMEEYDSFNLMKPGQQVHDMFVEVTPMTFPIQVKEGTSLNQLRLFYGKIEDAELKSDIARNSYLINNIHGDGSLSVDLSDTDVGGVDVAAFCADGASATDMSPIYVSEPIEEAKQTNPIPHWRFLNAENNRLTISKSDFYILRSKERITLPPGVAVYCRAMDETLGEMRIHYAGFVHPWFGLERPDNKIGTPLIFEVRGHDVDVNLTDGEKLARLTFYRMSENANKPPENGYNSQELLLSKFFNKFPSKLEKNMDGKVRPVAEILQ
jgi:dCTP deaminase